MYNGLLLRICVITDQYSIGNEILLESINGVRLDLQCQNYESNPDSGNDASDL